MAKQKSPNSISGRSPRRGFIVFDEGDRDATIDCVVRYASERGANLEFENGADLPSRFLFHMDDWSPSKQCVVVWKMGSLIGVEFETDDGQGV